MSAVTPSANHFLLYVQDLPNSQRAKHTKQHLAQNAHLFQSGAVRMGGALLAPDAKASDPDALEKVVGSFGVFEVDSIEAVWDIVKKDIFYTSGEVWDHEKIAVTPAYVPKLE